MLSLVPRPPRLQDDGPSASEAGRDLLAPLAAAARTDDPGAVRAFVEKIGPLLLRVVRKVLGDHHPDVEDVAQDAAFAVVTALGGFRGECRTSYFVSRVALLTAMAARRRVRYREQWTPATDPATTDALGVAEPAQHAEIVSERRRVALRALLDELPPPQADALCLHHMLGMNVGEISESSGEALNTVRSRLRRAKQVLVKRIEGDPGLLELLGNGVMGGES